MHAMNLFVSIITLRVIAIEKAMKEIIKLRAKEQVNFVLHARNKSILNLIHNLSLNSNFLI
jgi:hypothetical protein